MNTQRYQIHLDPDLHETLRRVAFERRLTMSQIVRWAIRDWLKAEGETAKPRKGKKVGRLLG